MKKSLRPKFKYIFREFYDSEDLDEDFEKVECPILNIKRVLPNGEYLIRGNKKSHATEYYLYNNQWYLVDQRTKDNGHYHCDSSTYQLFPVLPNKEYERMSTVGWRKLNPLWQRHLFGYEQWMKLRELSRDIHKMYIKELSEDRFVPVNKFFEK